MKLAALLLTLATFVPASALARKPDPAVEKAKGIAADADRKFKLGKFEEALAGFEAAYEAYPAPGLLFNIGQCHKSLRRWERAIFFFQGYLRDKPDAPNRAAVEKLIAEARQALAAEEEAARARQADERRAAEERRRADERRLAEEERRRAEEEERRRAVVGGGPAEGRPIYAKWWFWAAIGGAAVVATGAAFVLSGDEAMPSGSLGAFDWR